MPVEALKAQTRAQRVAVDLAPCTDGACEEVLPYDNFLIVGRLGMKLDGLGRAFVKLKGPSVSIRQNNAAIDGNSTLRAFAENDPAAAWAR
jgi:CRP/FNR family transcriptional regulator, dissimilatory nitrate respiration regulator